MALSQEEGGFAQVKGPLAFALTDVQNFIVLNGTMEIQSKLVLIAR